MGATVAELSIASRSITLADGQTAIIRQANINDFEHVRSLYYATYGDKYTIAEIADPNCTAKALSDRNDYLWIVTEVEGEIIGSVIFAVDPYHRMGKSFSGVIKREFRGQRIIYHMMTAGHDCLLCPGGPCDLLFAVVRTFVSPNFHRHLKELGYIDTGVFPNVRKVKDYETHGFKVCPGPHAFDHRSQPRFFDQALTLYRIVAQRFDLGPAISLHIELPTEQNKLIELHEVDSSKLPNGIEFERERLRQRGELRFGFYPLQVPNLMLTDAEESFKIFLNYQPVDGNASVLGLNTNNKNMVTILESIAAYCERIGVKYLELLASAHDPLLQAELWQASFIPCALFPAARYYPEDNHREDYLVASRTFVPLHFKGLKLTDDVKPLLLEFFKLYTGRLWEELVLA